MVDVNKVVLKLLLIIYVLVSFGCEPNNSKVLNSKTIKLEVAGQNRTWISDVESTLFMKKIDDYVYVNISFQKSENLVVLIKKYMKLTGASYKDMYVSYDFYDENNTLLKNIRHMISEVLHKENDVEFSGHQLSKHEISNEMFKEIEKCEVSIIFD